MNNLTPGTRLRCSAIFVTVLSVACLPIKANAAQCTPSKSTALVKQPPCATQAGPPHATAEENCGLVPRGGVSCLSEYELMDKVEASRLRGLGQNNNKPWWMFAAPWIAFGTVGLFFAVAWVVLNWRERVLNYPKKPDSRTIRDLQKLRELVTQALTDTEKIKTRVVEANAAIDGLWKTLATSNLLSGGQGLTKKGPKPE